ncbi:MAG: type II CRISPR-associated endonuclease Cas1 [Candidatus Hydrogenedentota bacterium]
MTMRIIEVAEQPRTLRVEHEQLVIRPRDETNGETVRAPLEDIAALVMAHPGVVVTHSVLAGISEAGGITVVCDRRNLPTGMVLPLITHHLQTERLSWQTTVKRPVQKQLWRQIVQAKIEAQGRALARLNDSDQGLPLLAKRVRSGDPANVEAQASRRYWRALFQDPEFRRDPEKEDQNILLNYGYGVLRALVARAACGAGLHPSIGIHHHNRYNPFCLADDLMEPYRPLVDEEVARWTREERGPLDRLTREAKAALISRCTLHYTVQGEARSLFDILAKAAVSLVNVYAGNAKRLELPTIEPAESSSPTETP